MARKRKLVLLEVDQGDVIEFIAENGSLESATNTVVRCEVEALMGMVGGSTGSGGAAGGNRSGSSGGTSSGQGGSGSASGVREGASGGSGGGAAASGGATAKAKSKAGATKKAGAPAPSRAPRPRARERIFGRRQCRVLGQRIGINLDGILELRVRHRHGQAVDPQLQLRGRPAHAPAWCDHQEHDDNGGQVLTD